MFTSTDDEYQKYFDAHKDAVAAKIKSCYKHYCNPNINSKFLDGDHFFITFILYIIIAIIFTTLCEMVLFKIISGLIFAAFIIWAIYAVNSRYNLFKYRIFLIFIVPIIVEGYVRGDENYSPDDYFYKMCIDHLTYYFQNAAYLWDKIEKE